MSRKTTVVVPVKGAIPVKQTKGSSGYDVASAEDDFVLEKGGIYSVSTNFYANIPEGYEGQLRARSGLASSYGIALVNGIGTIDNDYEGEIKVPLINLSSRNYLIRKGDRIAQFVLCPLVNFELDSGKKKAGGSKRPKVVIQEEQTIEEDLEDLEEDEFVVRGEGGFGSTGM